MICVLFLLALLKVEPSLSPVDFDTMVMPILTKAGCNSGACHGAAAGRGEFRLSLYGSRPDSDYDQIVRALEGRRIDRRIVEDSLLLKKATEQLSHGGGPRLDPAGSKAKIIGRWIAEGANRTKHRQLQSFHFNASRSVADRIGQTVQFSAIARFANGADESVLPWTVLYADDPSAVQISDSGVATVCRAGRHVVVARYLNKVAAVELIVPFSDALSGKRTEPVEQGHDSVRHQAIETQSDKLPDPGIDYYIDRKLQQLNLPVAGQAAEWLLARRLHLDLCGRLPRPDEISAFTNSTSALKLEQLIDRLLVSPDFVDFWTFRLASVLRAGSTSSPAYYNWIRECVANDVGYDKFTQQLLLSTGSVETSGPANFYVVSGDPRATAELVGSLFLGVRLQCANCHDHPLDAWTQEDYHGLAAVFAKIDRGSGTFIRNAQVINPATEEAARPKIPGQRFLSGDVDHRAELTRWMTSNENQYFQRAIVNRIWKYLMGHGLVEPIDDLRSTNPATHPELLQWLGEGFRHNNYSLRSLIRKICNSRAYQRSGRLSKDQTTQAASLNFYAAARPRLLSPEVYMDAIHDVTSETSERAHADSNRTLRAVSFSGLKAGDARNRSVMESAIPSLRQCETASDCSLDTIGTSELAVQLLLINGDVVNERLHDPNGQLMKNIQSGISSEHLIERFYQKAYSRLPGDEELRYWQQVFSAVQTTEQMEDIAQDFLWTLLTSAEFFTVR